MKASRLETYRRHLLQMRGQTVRSFLDLEGDLRTLAGEREIEYVDRAQAVAWEQVLAGLDDRAREQVEEIEAALERIESGSFGRCEECGEPLQEERLDTMLTARRCLPCQEALERSTEEEPVRGSDLDLSDLDPTTT
jgi:DnaK suppressor protein